MVLNFLKSSYKKVKEALSKTRSVLGQKLKSLFSIGYVDEHFLESLEQIFYEADLGLPMATELTEKVRLLKQKNPNIDANSLLAEIRAEIVSSLSQQQNALITIPKEADPFVILIVGVNGNGKTTTVAKLAKLFKENGNKVLIGAADTFRAAAQEQLEIWANRLQIDLVKGNPKSDPAAVAFDSISAGKARNADVVIIDTAGRLHTKSPLMHELEKIKKTCQKLHPGSPHETLLVLDATVGQNAVDQARIFNQFVPITGLIITKLDGTSKGGIVISISKQLNIPIKFIGTGESLEDLEPFQPEQFVQALFE